MYRSYFMWHHGKGRDDGEGRLFKELLDPWETKPATRSLYICNSNNAAVLGEMRLVLQLEKGSKDESRHPTVSTVDNCRNREPPSAICPLKDSLASCNFF
jgi:hypothetical protein